MLQARSEVHELFVVNVVSPYSMNILHIFYTFTADPDWAQNAPSYCAKFQDHPTRSSLTIIEGFELASINT
jgi:hypothetical protein